MNYPKENPEQIANEIIDRSIESNCREYFRRYPAYAEEVFGHLPTEEEIEDFFEKYGSLFVKDVIKKERRRL